MAQYKRLKPKIKTFKINNFSFYGINFLLKTYGNESTND